MQHKTGTLILFFGTIVILLSACSLSAQTPMSPPSSFWEGFAYDGHYAIEVDSPTAMMDVPIKIRVTGLQAKQPVTVRAQINDASNQAWESFATFIADDSGTVDVSRATPQYGSYFKPDGMGLFWSLRPVSAKDPAAISFKYTGRDPLVVTLTVKANGKILASTQVTRLRFPDEKQVVHQSIKQDGMVGSLYYPAAPGKYPTILWLGGSGGGIEEYPAALLAPRGYAVFALAYFGIDPLPQTLFEIPLEYFGTAIAWLKTLPYVDPQRIAVMGGSKGGELALLVGATYPDIKAVIGYVPSGVVYQGIQGMSSNWQEYQKKPRSSWSLNGKPVPYLLGAITLDWINLPVGQPIAMRSSYEQPLDDKAAVAAATIAVEKTRGPILLLSGTDDQMWPSARLADIAIERLKANNFIFPYEHIKYAGAGHAFGFPYRPTGATRSGAFITGGTLEANAFASADAWQKTVAFLEKYLR